MSWSLKPAADVVIPELSPHWHPPGCACVPAVAYLRVSKVGDREQVTSPMYQLEAIEHYARLNDIRFVAVVADIDKSGRTFRKRSVDRIIKEIKKGTYRKVILYKWSRWARNTEESAKYAGRVREAGGAVESATEDEDLNTAVGKLKKHIIVGFDQYQSDLISESWHSALANRRRQGLPHGGRDRFGYDYVDGLDADGHKTKRYLPNADRELVAFAYEQFVAGASLNDITRHFNKAGARTAFGKAWTAQGLARMLDTGFAAGFIRERSQPSDTPSNSIRDYDVWREGSHEPIIGADLWRRFKSMRMAAAGSVPARIRAVHSLSGLLFCAVCRRRLVTKYAGRDKKHQWICPWQRVLHPQVAIGVANPLAESAVRDWVADIVGGKVDIAAAQADAEAEIAREQAEQNGERQRLRARFADLEATLDNLIDMATAQRGRAREKIDQRIRDCEAELEQVQQEMGSDVDHLDRGISQVEESAFRALGDVWSELPPEELRDSLAELVSRIEVGPRSAESTRKSARDRVIPVGAWALPALKDWYSERPSIPA